MLFLKTNYNINFKNKRNLFLYILSIYNIASPPIIEVVEDNSEPADEYDMSFLNDVLEQYNQNLHHQGLRTRMFEKKETMRMCAHENIFLLSFCLIL